MVRKEQIATRSQRCEVRKKQFDLGRTAGKLLAMYSGNIARYELLTLKIITTEIYDNNCIYLLDRFLINR